MCGRDVRRSDKQMIAEHFHAQPQPADLPMPDADYNVAPAIFQPIIRQSRGSGEREMVLARWGSGSVFHQGSENVKDLTTINARSETIATAPTWREPFRRDAALCL